MPASPHWQFAPSTESIRRRDAIAALVAVLEPDLENRPSFLSDEATAFEVLAESEDEIRSRLVASLGSAVAGVPLGQPLWQLVDELAALVPGWPPE
jgi:hypothetical protein